VNKKIALLALISLGIPFTTITMAPKPSLTAYTSSGKLKAAAVLPYTENHPDFPNERVFLLARENSGNYNGQYTDFGGKNDIKAKHPIQLAAKELHEETAGVLDEKWALNHIDLKTGNTQYLLIKENKGWVTYITKFDYKDLKKVTDGFYTACNKATKPEYKEKDKLAWVKESDMKKSITSAQKNGKGEYQATVPALIVDQRRTKAQNKKSIPLTSMFIAKLRSYYNGAPYTPGKDPKIRFYNS
jgi:hypothetical protein